MPTLFDALKVYQIAQKTDASREDHSCPNPSLAAVFELCRKMLAAHDPKTPLPPATQNLLLEIGNPGLLEALNAKSASTAEHDGEESKRPDSTYPSPVTPGK